MLFSDEAGFGGFGCRVFTDEVLWFCWGQDLAPKEREGESERERDIYIIYNEICIYDKYMTSIKSTQI